MGVIGKKLVTELFLARQHRVDDLHHGLLRIVLAFRNDGIRILLKLIQIELRVLAQPVVVAAEPDRAFDGICAAFQQLRACELRHVRHALRLNRLVQAQDECGGHDKKSNRLHSSFSLKIPAAHRTPYVHGKAIFPSVPA